MTFVDNVSRETGIPEGVHAALSTLVEILRHLGVSSNPFIDGPDGDGAWSLRLSGPDVAIVIGRHGQTLEAIDYVLNRVGFAKDPSAPRITVDVEGYRERREEALVELAERTASPVQATGSPTALSPMSPRDRRIVHLALAEHPTVTTRSEGTGTYKRLVIVPRLSGR